MSSVALKAPSSPLPGFLWVLTLPLSLVWGRVMQWRRNRRPLSERYLPKSHAICVGNIHSGGSGKTPLVKELADVFAESRPAIISRGYGGEAGSKGSWVEAQGAGPAYFGDEAWSLSKSHRVYVDRDRLRAVHGLESSESLLIFDDGFQDVRLLPQVRLVAINVGCSFEESYCLPLGMLREPLSALSEATAIVLTGAPEDDFLQWEEELTRRYPKVPRFRAVRRVEGLCDANGPVEVSGQRLGGFCALANPDRFFRSLSSVGEVVPLASFRDHFRYPDADLSALLDKAKKMKVDHLVTSEKDWHKVEGRFRQRGAEPLYLKIRYQLDADLIEHCRQGERA